MQAGNQAGCPNWDELVTARDLSGENPPAWRAGLAHMESCARCQHEALVADPTLIFQRLARPAASDTASRPVAVRRSADIDAIRQGVAALREASRLGATVAGHPSDSEEESKPRFSRRNWWQAAAAAALVAFGLSLSSAVPVDRTATTPPAMEQVQAGEDLNGDLPWATLPYLLASNAAVQAEMAMPLIEDLDLPDPRVYQIAEEGVQVVMVFDESLEIDL